jgi:DNA-binding GntR family transcriptional regulator
MQRRVPGIARDNLSDALTTELREMIVNGRLAAEARVNEVHVSEQLGVSRTPLREALARLAHEGALESVPRIGYFVRALTLEEFDQIYAIRPLLDPEALRLAGLPSREQMDRLQKTNLRMESARDGNKVIALDDEWHLELVAHCPNRVLLELIQQFMQRTRRYEMALMRERKSVTTAGADHRTILAALRRRDLRAACRALRANLQGGRGPIVAWLSGRG